VTVGEKDDKFIFTVESTGVLPPEEIVVRALRILRNKLENLKDVMDSVDNRNDYY
jgi:DNA-directed RNA polymerase I and III subunit RPAC1